ncbi:SulP family inorganic anion transporter [Luedemannella helvata]|uniref:SulP family inorganic anion transporter n=1 Tax=Luedemannella helvata TaxID=349315 RepID=A0ABP4X9J5_9ACTN
MRTRVLSGARRRVGAVLPRWRDLAAMREQPRANLVAGVTVAVVALPLALGFGVSSGLGAGAGLATAIVAGCLAAIFGGSNLQVTGPTGAMTAVLVPITASYGASGVLTVGLLAGVLLVVLALTRAGRYARYVPAPLVEGFTLGIAAVIFLQQVPGALGVVGHGDKVVTIAADAVRGFAGTPHWPALAVAAGVGVLVLVGLARRPKIPFSLLAVVAATATAELFDLPLARIGALPATLPAPSLAFLDPAQVPALVTAAVAVAALAALESLLCATVADSMRAAADPHRAAQRHDPDRELFGQGLANIAAPLFGGVPATAAIARTAVSVKAGASTRLAALSHAAVLAAMMLALAPLVALVPIAALAGVLFATAIRMVHLATLVANARASRSDAVIMTMTAVATVALDLVTAVLVGLGVAVVLALRKVIKAVHIERLSEEHLHDVLVLRPVGPLFWAAAHTLEHQLAAVRDVRCVLIRMSRVSVIDASGAQVLRDAITDLQRRGIVVYLSGLHLAHHKPLAAFGILDDLDGRVFSDALMALQAAAQHPPRHTA